MNHRAKLLLLFIMATLLFSCGGAKKTQKVGFSFNIAAAMAGATGPSGANTPVAGIYSLYLWAVEFDPKTQKPVQTIKMSLMELSADIPYGQWQFYFVGLSTLQAGVATPLCGATSPIILDSDKITLDVIFSQTHCQNAPYPKMIKERNSNLTTIGAPLGLSLLSPLASPGVDTTPTIRVSGVTIGDTIQLFTDSSCATTALGSVVAAGTTVDITTSALAVASYTFYVNSTTAAGNVSNCSSATVNYSIIPCPSGYVAVPSNLALGVNDFCVMQFEAKNVGGVATSQAASLPWVSINQTSAKTNCTSLGTQYDLISNPEWMTIAHEIESTPSNWSSGMVSSGMLNRGHSDNVPGAALAVTTIIDPYDGTSNTSGEAAGSGWEQKRTHTLSNGVTLWDFAGNVTEWVDWSLGGSLTIVTPTNKAYNTTDSVPQAAWKEFSLLDTNIAGADEMAASSWQAYDITLNSSNGIGRYFAGSPSTGGAAERGGRWSVGTNAGVYSLSLNDPSSYNSIYVGFRCVYRP